MGRLLERAGKVGTLAALVAHPGRIRPLLASLPRIQRSVSGHDTHLDAGIRWLCRAQDAAGDGGVSYGYSLTAGWLPPYPETTGYIIPTFLAYARHRGPAEYRQRALRMAEWEMTVQLPDGSIPGGAWRPGRPAVGMSFDTGQVLQGWCALYAESRDERLLRAAVRAGEWLLTAQRADGAWEDIAPGRRAPTTFAFNTRTSWSLLELSRLSGMPKYGQAALRNLEWTLGQQAPNGWFRRMAFAPDELPITHTLGYVLEGLLECWKLTAEATLLEAARRGSAPLLDAYEREPFLELRVGPDWTLSGGSACVTGCAQLARVFMLLRQATGETRAHRLGVALLEQVKAWQFARPELPGLDGALPGSVPVYGRYEPLRCPNWGVKFFCDALLEAIPSGAGDLEISGAPLTKVVERA